MGFIKQKKILKHVVTVFKQLNFQNICIKHKIIATDSNMTLLSIAKNNKNKDVIYT